MVDNGKTCLTMFFCLNSKENTHLLHYENITLEKITNVRGVDSEGNIEAFFFFLNDLVPCVPGRKVWTQQEKANDVAVKRGNSWSSIED